MLDVVKTIRNTLYAGFKNLILFIDGYSADIIQWNTALEQYNQISIMENYLN